MFVYLPIVGRVRAKQFAWEYEPVFELGLTLRERTYIRRHSVRFRRWINGPATIPIRTVTHTSTPKWLRLRQSRQDFPVDRGGPVPCKWICKLPSGETVCLVSGR